MAIRNIILEGNEILNKKCRPVEKFDERLWQLIDDMKETMYNSNGVGLAAPQVGILRRVVVVDVGDGLIELVNPEIIEQDGEQREIEGCLSCRAVWHYNKTYVCKSGGERQNGKDIQLSGMALKARAFCHEIDHLDGILFKSKVISGDINLKR